MKTSTLYGLLFTLMVAGPANVTAHDRTAHDRSTYTGLGIVPSGMGLGTAPGGTGDRQKKDGSLRLKFDRADKIKDFHHHRFHHHKFHHHRFHKPRFHGFKHGFTPAQVFLIQKHRAGYRDYEDMDTVYDFGFHQSFEELRSDFGDSRSFEEIRAQFLSVQ